MKKHLLFIPILCLAYFFSSCDNPSTPSPPIDETPQDSTDTQKQVISTQKIGGMPFSLLIIADDAIIYESPKTTAKEISRLQTGDSIIFTNEISTESSTHRIHNVPFDEPWLRVISTDNKMGWLHGSYTTFHPSQNPLLAEKVLYKRVANFFGANLAQQLSIYNKEKNSIQSLPAFRLLYTRSTSLKDSIGFKLKQHIQLNPATTNIDFYWLNDLLEGLALNYIEDEKKYYLFRDFKHWQQLSLATPSPADDDFVQVMLRAYQMDSIEYHLYDWQMPLDNGIICSTLGQGIYTQVLDKIEATQNDSTGYFKPEITQIKQAIINDISSSSHFWLSLDQIIQELNTILDKSYSFLDANDRTELKTKKQLLKKYQKNNIQVNLFEGI